MLTHGSDFMYSFTLTALLFYSPINSSFSPYTKNIIIKTLLQIWRQFRLYYGFQTFSVCPDTVKIWFPTINDGQDFFPVGNIWPINV